MRYATLLIFVGVSLICTPAPAVGQVPVVRFKVERFLVGGANPVPASETEAALAPYLGEHAGLDGLLARTSRINPADRLCLLAETAQPPPSSAVSPRARLPAFLAWLRAEALPGEHRKKALPPDFLDAAAAPRRVALVA